MVKFEPISHPPSIELKQKFEAKDKNQENYIREMEEVSRKIQSKYEKGDIDIEEKEYRENPAFIGDDGKLAFNLT